MSIESAKAFIDRMNTDEDFSAKVITCKDAEARMAFIDGEGFAFTTEEIVAVQKELDDAELDVVAK